MDFTGIVISIIIAVIALIFGIVGIIILFSTSTEGKYGWEWPSITITTITVVLCAIFLKFAHDGLHNSLLNYWLIYFMILLIVLNPLLASIGANDTWKNVTTNIVGMVFLAVAIGLILIA